MLMVLLGAGIGLLLVGLGALGYGIQYKEFGFGNTLVVAGAVAACSGFLMTGLWAVARELQNIAQRLGGGAVARVQPALPAEPSLAPPPHAPAKARPPISAQRRHGWKAAATRRRPRLKLHRRRSRGAICYSPRPRARNANAPRRAPASRSRRICFRRICVRIRRPSTRRRSSRLHRRPSKTPGRDRIARGVRPVAPRRMPLRRASAAPSARRRAAGDRAEVRRGRRHGLFALFRRLDRGADAGGHDALCLHRRAARASRPAALKRSNCT